MRRLLIGLASLALLLAFGWAIGFFMQMERSTSRIEVLGFAGCPNTPQFRERVAVAVREAGLDANVSYIDQQELPERDVRRGYPTPTVLVDGRDLYGLPTPTGPAMGCRIYPGGLPTADDIAARLVAER